MRSANNKICVNIKKFFGSVKINLSVKGEKFDFEDSLNFGLDFNQENISEETAAAISNLVIRAFAGKLSYKHHGGKNYIIISASKSPYTSLYYTGAALILAIITGLVMKSFASEAVCTYFELLSSVSKIFMNCLKLCAIALVFFSIASCIANIGNLSDLKKIGGTLSICFVLLQILALIIGMIVFYTLKPGANIAINSVTANTSNIVSGSVSIRDTIINIFPDNLVKPFLICFN